MKEKGKFKGKLKKWFQEDGKHLAGKVLQIGGDLSGQDWIKTVGDKLLDDPTVSADDKEMIKSLKEADLKELEILETNFTARHKIDMMSDSWLSKNIRPLVVANFTLLIDFMIIMATFDRPLAERYIGLIMTLGVTVLGGYFTIRTVEKRNQKKYDK